MTPSGIEPEIFRFVAQHLNHWATAVPQDARYERKIQAKLCQEQDSEGCNN